MRGCGWCLQVDEVLLELAGPDHVGEQRDRHQHHLLKDGQHAMDDTSADDNPASRVSRYRQGRWLTQ